MDDEAIGGAVSCLGRLCLEVSNGGQVGHGVQ